ncbi:hypothetical protein LTR53_011935 [Teratosphaeriaceae sp. CCFEE 6253]|nr:hypothetical protein LTR53_011935 [Teratosphaeriaceae sp. CCFEE 6253]
MRSTSTLQDDWESTKEATVSTQSRESLGDSALAEASADGERASQHALPKEREARLRKVYRKADLRLLGSYAVLFMLVKASAKNLDDAIETLQTKQVDIADTANVWYPAGRMPLRIAALYTAGQSAGMLSGLLAFGISYMNGLRGFAGWRWLFLLEGAPVLLGGLAACRFLPDYPETSTFLEAEERELVLSELPANQPKATAKTWDWIQVKALSRDPLFYLFILIWTGHAIGGYSVALVLPTVLFALKLEGTTITQLLTMPPYALAIALVLILAALIRRGRANPWMCAIALELLVCGCYAALLIVRNAVAKYILVSLALVCAGSVMPLLWPERLRSAEGTTATGLAIGITSTCAHLTGIVGPHIYSARFGPRYRVSFATSIGSLALGIVAMLASWIIIRRRDAKTTAARSVDEVQSAREGMRA